LHDAATERAMPQACVMAGAVDGTGIDAQVAVLTLLAELVGKALAPATVDY
jgi:hypothetical protein